MKTTILSAALILLFAGCNSGGTESTNLNDSTTIKPCTCDTTKVDTIASPRNIDTVKTEE